MATINRNIKMYLSLIFFCISASLFAQVTDTDNDGISDNIDKCSGTPSGVSVNAYGCPLSLINCDYNVNNFTMNVTGPVPTTTKYLLVNSATGIIEQITSTPSFTALTGSKTYMALAYSYSGATTGLTVGNQLSGISASCQDISEAIMIKVCVATSLPTLSLNDITVNENAGTATITVSTSNVSNTAITFSYTTANGSAISGSDYSLVSGTATIAAGSTNTTITIPIIDDIVYELSQDFSLNITNATGATISDAQGLVTINDNDVMPSLSIVPMISFAENAGVATITVSLSGASSQPISVNYATSNGTATSGIDFATKTGTILFNAGETTKTISINISDDLLIENNENFIVTLSNPNGANITTDIATITVIDNDANTQSCDFTTPTITVQSSMPPSGTITKYVLAKQSDMIIQVSNTPAFTGLSGTDTYNVYAISYTGTINNLSFGNTVQNVNGSCYDWSEALKIKVCICKPDICIPIVVKKVK